MKNLLSLLAVCAAVPSWAIASGCNVNVYTSPTTLDAASFGPMSYGRPPWNATQAFAAASVMNWTDSLTQSVPADSPSFFLHGGTFTYFLLAYHYSECSTHFGLDRRIAQYIGAYEKGDSPGLVYKLYALKNDGQQFNEPVTLTGKILIGRQASLD